MKKRILTVIMAFAVAFAAIVPVTVALAPQQTQAAEVAKYVRISKTTAKNIIPSNALKKKGSKYYVNTQKLAKMAATVAKKGKLNFVEYEFDGLNDGKTYTCTYTNPNGKYEGSINPKGSNVVYLQSSTQYRYFNTKTGIMKVGLHKIKGEYCYFKKNGYLLMNGKRTVKGRTYIFQNGFCVGIY